MILLVLSDCIGFTIIPLFHTLEKRSSRVALPGWTSSRKACKPSSTWSVSPFPLFYGVVTHNVYGSFSLRETMLSLKQPYIEWSDGILSTGYHPIDRQHEWLLTIVNISTWVMMMHDAWWLVVVPSRDVLIHVNTGNQADICIYDVLDALSDYVWIHFTDEEAIFMNHPYPCQNEMNNVLLSCVLWIWWIYTATAVMVSVS